MLRPASRQVCTILQGLLSTYLMFFAGPEPSLYDRSKTSKEKIEIKMDANGRPEIPSVTEKDNCYGKVLQTALREYCTAHIRESIYSLFTYHITFMSQGIFLGGIRHPFRGPSCALTQGHGC